MSFYKKFSFENLLASCESAGLFFSLEFLLQSLPLFMNQSGTARYM